MKISPRPSSCTEKKRTSRMCLMKCAILWRDIWREMIRSSRPLRCTEKERTSRMCLIKCAILWSHVWRERKRSPRPLRCTGEKRISRMCLMKCAVLWKSISSAQNDIRQALQTRTMSETARRFSLLLRKSVKKLEDLNEGSFRAKMVGDST